MILLLLILTGVQFATNELNTVHYALTHPANVSPLVFSEGGDVITNCFDVTAGRPLTSNECFGAPAPLSVTWTFNTDPLTKDVEVWHHVGPLDGKPFFKEFQIYQIVHGNTFTVPNTNVEEHFVIRATCPWAISDWCTN